MRQTLLDATFLYSHIEAGVDRHVCKPLVCKDYVVYTCHFCKGEVPLKPNRGQRLLPSIWPYRTGPSPPPSPPLSPKRPRAKRKWVRGADPRKSRLRRERAARTLVYKWIDAYPHKVD